MVSRAINVTWSWYVTACVATGLGTAVWGAINWGTVCFDNFYFFAYGTLVWHAACLLIVGFFFVLNFLRGLCLKNGNYNSYSATAGVSVPALLYVALIVSCISYAAPFLADGKSRLIVSLLFAAVAVISVVPLSWLVSFFPRILKTTGKRLVVSLCLVPLLFFYVYIFFKDVPGYLDEKPTVVVVVIDALRSDHLGVYGYEKDTSPNIDAFAGSGTVFTKAISPAPWTSPAVASLFTSTLPSTHTVKYIRSALPSEAVTLAEILEDEGYTTVCVSGNPNVSKSLVQGFDYYYGVTTLFGLEPVISSYFGERLVPVYRGVVLLTGLSPERSPEDADIATAVAIEKAAKYGRRPLFLYVHYMDPHSPYSAPEPWDEYFGPPTVYGKLPISPARTIAEKMKNRYYVPPLTGAHIKEFIRSYDCEIRFCDEYVAELLDWVGRNRQGRCLTVITADHGEQFFDHPGYLHHGGSVYKELLEVPLLLYCSDVETVPYVDAQVGLIDVLPTILDWRAIARRPEETSFVSGKSLLPLATGERIGNHGFIVSENSRDLPPSYREIGVSGDDHFEHKSIQNERYKLIVDYQWGVEELFDIRYDRSEQENILNEYPDVAAGLRYKLRSIIDEAATESLDTREEDISSEYMKRLETLGYVR